MKKISTLLLLMLFSSAGIYAQNYGSNQTTGTSEPYAYNNNGSAQLTVPSNDVLSSWQTIPFTWSFYGVQQSGYYISDNGYITFDQGASVSDPANGSIPDVGGPNNAIYAFWDDIDIVSGSGSTDEVVTFDYGSAPNRTHVIQWYSVTPQGGSGFLYVAIRLHECGDFDIIHNFGNATGMSATVGCENDAGSAGTMVEGPSFDYPSLGSAGDDDVVYTFYWDGIDYDLATVSDFGTNIGLGSNNVTGTVTNNGATAVTSFDLHYTVNGGATQTQAVTANIPANGGTYAFTHATPWVVANGGENLQLCVWADNINGNADQRTCNDQDCRDLFSNNGVSASDVNVVIEEFTGAWCGWCPDGEVVLSDLESQYPNDVIIISVHDGDDMEYNEGIRSAFGVSAYPNAMVDRTVFDGEPDEPHSRGDWEANTVTSMARYTPVEVSITHTYNSATRQIDATVTADFVDFAAGDMRLVFAVTEDNVTGTGSGYDQVNYLNSTSGHPYENAGDPIVGYSHPHVLRANPAGAFGNSGVIPSPVSPGSTYSESFTYTLPASYDENEISVVGFVAYYSTNVGERAIMNGDEKHLSEAVGVAENLLVGSMDMYPNPADNQLTVDVSFNEPTSADLVIYDAFGKEVQKLKTGTYAAGSHIINTDISGLAAGVYYVTIRTAEHSYTQKLVVK